MERAERCGSGREETGRICFFEYFETSRRFVKKKNIIARRILVVGREADSKQISLALLSS